MSATFMHVARFVGPAGQREAFIEAVRSYEDAVDQAGLDHSHLIQGEQEPDVFCYVSIRSAREAWEQNKGTEAHQAFHAAFEPLLAEPYQHNFGHFVL